MSSRIPHLIEAVNNVLHNGHEQGLIDPLIMAATRRSNCFGRLAVIGSALLIDQPDADLNLLVCRNHGLKFREGRYWFGHTALVVRTGVREQFVDAATHAFTRDLYSETSWQADRASGTVTEYSKDPNLRAKPANENERAEQEKRYGPSHVAALTHKFRVYDFDEGLRIYQEGHPAYGQHPLHGVEDYAAVMDAIPESAPMCRQAEALSII